MIYEVYLDGELLYYPGDKEYVISDAVLNQALNDSGTFEFDIPVTNPMYNKIYNCQSMIQILKDGKEIFYGEVRENEEVIEFEKHICAIGELSFLFDSIQPQKRYQNYTPTQFFEELLAYHNSHVEEKKKFKLGMVTVTDPNESIYRFTNREDTLTAIREKLCDKLDGKLRIRKVNGERYLDLIKLEDYGKTCTQPIEFGINMLDYAANSSGFNISTAVIPLGARLEESVVEGLDAYTTIESVNNGVDYVYSEEAVQRFGWKTTVQKWDDVTIPANLKKKAEEWLKSAQYETLTLEVNAVDLSMMNSSIDAFDMGDIVNALAEPFGMDTWFPVQKKTTYLLDFAKNYISLGNTMQKSYTQQMASQTSKLEQEIPQRSDLVIAAQRNASEIIKAALSGYVVIKMGEDDKAQEILIMDTNNIETAKRVWRWNINGLGYSDTGYNGTYRTAMTMDGQFVADFITTGTLSADRIRGGKLIAGGVNDEYGCIEVQDDKGNVIGKWTRGGIDAYGKLTSSAVDAWDYHSSIDASIKDGAFYMEDGLGNLLGVLEKHRQSSDADQGGIALLSNINGIRFGFIFATNEEEAEEDNWTDVHWAELFYEMFNPETSGLNYVHLFRKNAEFTDNVDVNGIISAKVFTQNYGPRKLASLASAEPYFADMGSATIGNIGECTIPFDPVFAQTVDAAGDYKVFITPTSKSADLWVQKHAGSFTVYGTAGATFDWMIYCKQLNRSNIRLEQEG